MQIVPDTEEPIVAIIEEPAPAPAPEPAPQPEPAAIVAEESPAPAPEPAPAPKAPAMVPLRVLQERVGEVTRKKDQDIEALQRRNAEYEAILARIQRGDPPAAAGDPPAQRPAAAAAPASGDASFEEAVQRTVTAREAGRAITAMVAQGKSEFTAAEWNEKAEILGAVGAASPEFVMDVIAADPANAHKIIYSLAQDPERAASLANMDIRQRTAELTRMSMAEQAKAPAAQAAPAGGAEPPKTQISKAPAPKPPIAPHAPAADVDPRTPEGNEKMSDEQWGKWYKDTYMKRTG